MNKNTQKNVLKTALGFCAIATVLGISAALIGSCKQSAKLIATGVGVALLSEAGLGIALEKYSNRQKELC